MNLAMIGEDLIHSFIYPAHINGYNRDLMERYGGWMADMHPEHDGVPLDSRVHISTIVSSDEIQAEQIAKTCRIERTISKVTHELVEELDGAIIMERDGNLHLEMARPFLERGKFVYIDKPVVQKISDLRELENIAKTNHATVLGGSAVRYSQRMKEAIVQAQFHKPISIHMAGPGPWFEYGSHMVEAFIILMGSKVQSTTILGTETSGAAVLKWDDERYGVIQFGKGYPPGFTVQLFGEGKIFQTNLDDPIIYYQGVSRQIVAVATGESKASDWSELAAITEVVEEVGNQFHD